VTAALVLAALLTVACVVAVALPFLREPSARDDVVEEPDAIEMRRLGLAERRDRAHRTGKVSDEDYRTLVGSLRREAAEALRALEPHARAADTRAGGVAAEPAESRPTR
jgi:hypothetical protein